MHKIDTRLASDKQKMFIQSLLKTKAHSYGESVDVESLDLTTAKKTISHLLSLPTKEGLVIPATDKQIAYAESLIQKKEEGFALLADYLQKRKVQELKALDKADVSEMINALKNSADKQAPITITEVGAYLLNGVVHSIRLGKDSKKLQVWSYFPAPRKYLRDVANENTILPQLQPSDRLTLDLAIKYSAQVGICVHCGRTLTLLRSVAGGMGAVCAKKYH